MDSNEEDKQRWEEELARLKQEMEEEKANVEFLQTGAFNALEKTLLRDIEKNLNVLYNNGKPAISEEEVNSANSAKVEIRVRKEFLRRMTESPSRLQLLSEDYEELKNRGGI